MILGRVVIENLSIIDQNDGASCVLNITCFSVTGWRHVFLILDLHEKTCSVI